MKFSLALVAAFATSSLALPRGSLREKVQKYCMQEMGQKFGIQQGPLRPICKEITQRCMEASVYGQSLEDLQGCISLYLDPATYKSGAGKADKGPQREGAEDEVKKVKLTW
ncbi:hypothetical protein ED733_003404 [Metarhizium rileyi]|uniref:Uncharacterized protein n=1 Tax=Metarhizium rileyi (strain RCEF 4871) TaxID=1649241 RepID=A0A5C6G6J1_METRR|nr:hypothetical protein ED733_003404 [Metarhizium rileyi]